MPRNGAAAVAQARDADDERHGHGVVIPHTQFHGRQHSVIIFRQVAHDLDVELAHGVSVV